MVERILIVDDDPTAVNLFSESLEHDGYRVITGFDGQAAIQLARTQRPDLIILDVNMPITNGFHALRFLRGLQETKDIPIILLSGERSDNIYPVIDQLSGIVFLKKPVELDDLHSTVRRLLDKAL